MKFTGGQFIGSVFWAVLLSVLLIHPAGLAADEPDRNELDAMGGSARAKLIEQRPDLSEKLDELPGYAAISMTSTKIPGVGTGLGYGVIIDNRSDQRSYVKVTQLEVGGGLGAQKFKLVILFKDAALLDGMIKGGWRYESAVDLDAGSNSTDSESKLSSKSGKGYKVFKLAESGALATITIRLLYATPYVAD